MQFLLSRRKPLGGDDMMGEKIILYHALRRQLFHLQLHNKAV
jgi:hypothetical protein